MHPKKYIFFFILEYGSDGILLISRAWEKIKIMSRASSGQSIRVGSQVYQINITPQEGFQLEFRFLET